MGIGQQGITSPGWGQPIYPYAFTATAGTTGTQGFTSSPITYTTSTNTASSSYSTTGALNKQ